MNDKVRDLTNSRYYFMGLIESNQQIINDVSRKNYQLKLKIREIETKLKEIEKTTIEIADKKTEVED
jgi:hypothetical protein